MRPNMLNDSTTRWTLATDWFAAEAGSAVECGLTQVGELKPVWRLTAIPRIVERGRAKSLV